MKKLTLFLTVIFVANVGQVFAQQTTYTTVYAVGDIGPAGGLIFYANPNYENDGWKYMEAAPNDIMDNTTKEPALTAWSNKTVESVGNTNTGIGTGYQNTLNIDKQSSNSAAGACATLTVTNGTAIFSKWFLPSQDELQQMYIHLVSNGKGDFKKYYWSSSEVDEKHAWSHHFSFFVEQMSSTKGDTFYVRCARAF